MSDKATSRTRKKYNRFSRLYDFMESLIERMLFKRSRKETISKLKGDILEIGVGTGKNLQHYNAKAKVTGIDLSLKMLERAKKKAEDARLKAKLQQMDAQRLDFKDESFDHVVGSFVLCSVPDPVKALKEVRRVMKPKGKAIFVEHVLSKHKLIAFLEHLHNPLTSGLFGFNVNRDTRENIIKTRFHIIHDEKLAFHDVFRKFTCSKTRGER